MAGYLDQYGAGEERREKTSQIVKRALLAVVALVVIGGGLFFVFHDYREEQRVKQFFTVIQAHDYKGGYALFGCTEAKPCRYYPMEKFMEDWGPASGRSFEGAHITRSRSCGSGVLLTVDFNKSQPEKLWVERADMSVGFPPVQGCPAAP
jgi:hypothetical protein